MNTNRMMAEIWDVDIHWILGNDSIRSIYMYNSQTGVGLYADTAEDAIRKVWLMIYGNRNVDLEILPPSYGMVKG